MINHRVLYVGMTSDLERRMYEHKNKIIKGFTAKYRANKLILCEEFNDPLTAFTLERKIKGWTRAKKMALIESKNPHWDEIII